MQFYDIAMMRQLRPKEGILWTCQCCFIVVYKTVTVNGHRRDMSFASFLQSKLQECQKTVDELEAELQRANNKVCHTGHLLNQMTVKVTLWR